MATDTAVARERIAQLMDQAGTAGDLETVELCRLALMYKTTKYWLAVASVTGQAWVRCIEILEEAKAADDDCAEGK